MAEPVSSSAETSDAAGRYKVVELTTVTDETMEEALNTWTAKGFVFDSVHFVLREGSRRPSMAFLVFDRESASSEP